MISLIFSCWTFRGVSGDGSGVTVEGSIPVADETIATPPPADTKASILLISIRDFKMCIYWVCERMDVIWFETCFYNECILVVLLLFLLDYLFWLLAEYDVIQATTAEDDDDDDVDLFGEETEEEKKAAEERAAAVKASSKKKECKLCSYWL